jgi:hypothetical protein
MRLGLKAGPHSLSAAPADLEADVHRGWSAYVSLRMTANMSAIARVNSIAWSIYITSNPEPVGLGPA